MTHAVAVEIVREPGPWARLPPGIRRGVMIGVVLLTALVALRAFVVHPVQIKGASMEPTYSSGTWVFIDAWSDAAPTRGQVVVFSAPAGSGARHDELIKRVIATAGQRVSMHNCVVSVDRAALVEPYVLDEPTCGAAEVPELIVPQGAVYVLGDHRSDSLDSRAFGPVSIDAVDGRVMGKAWPL